MENNKLENKLKSLEAFLLSQEKGTEEGVALLKDSTDPDSIRRKLSILLNADQVKEAIASIKDISPHERWCDKAISAYVRNDDIIKAEQLLEWTKTIDDEIFRNRCRIYYAEARYMRAWRKRKEGDVIHLGTLNVEEKKELDDTLVVLQPIIAKVIAERKVYNEIESLALQIAVKIHYLLNEKQKIENLSSILLTRVPVPIEAGRLALIRYFKTPSNLPERLRNEHVNSFDAYLLAAILESEIFGENKNAYENVKKIIVLAKNESKKYDICKALYQIAQYMNNDIMKETKEICISLIGEEHRFIFLIKADLLMRQKNLPNTLKYLIKAKDEEDSNWLQLYAHYLYLNNRPKDALEYLDRARAIFPHPELYKSAAQLAFETENYDLTIELLKHELQKEPDNIILLNNLAASCFRKGDYGSAVEPYNKLIKLKPEEISSYLNLAVCYTQIGKSEEALKTYEEICKRDNAPLDAFLAKAHLENIDDPKKAFNTLLPLKEEYWENPQYLMAVLNLSYKAGQEEYAHQALLKLRELQLQGKAPQEILQAKTIKDLEIYAKEWSERIQIINQNLIKGVFPWLMADHWQNHTAYMGWRFRTQPLDWSLEEPMTCASYSIYSTNSFTVVKQSDDTTKLDCIECPAKGTDIVIDLSALITLHQLKILDQCIEYFREIYVPREYPIMLLKDSDGLVIHQHTRKTSAEAIKKAIDAGWISILDDIGSPSERPLHYVHEHTIPEKEEEHYYRLIDIINIAYDIGKLDEDKYNNLKRISNKPSGVNPDHPKLKHHQSLFVDLHTLYSICQIDTEAIAPILDTFRMFVSKQDQIRNSNEVTQISTQENIKILNDDLLNIIRDNDKFIKQGHTQDKCLGDHEFLESWGLSRDKSLPLLVDDRMIQNLALIENNSVDNAAFGTDRLLLKLHEERIIDIESSAKAILQLIRWRYRFIVPSKDILLHYAKRYKNHPPGKDLQDVALYLHECTRDPGLFAGLENTTLKESMAIRLYATWTSQLTKFLADVWADIEFTEENATIITNWTLMEFMPSIPKNTGEKKRQISEIQPKAIFDLFLAYAFIIDDTSRANKALQTIAECLNMSEKEYVKAVAEVVDQYGI